VETHGQRSNFKVFVSIFFPMVSNWWLPSQDGVALSELNLILGREPCNLLKEGFM